MRAKRNVYHLECFACQQCNHRSVGNISAGLISVQANNFYSFRFYPAGFALAIDSSCVIIKFCAKSTTRIVRCAPRTMLRQRIPRTTATTTTTKALIKISSVPETKWNHHRHSSDMLTAATTAMRAQTSQSPIIKQIPCHHFTQTITWIMVMCDVLPKWPSGSGRQVSVIVSECMNRIRISLFSVILRRRNMYINFFFVVLFIIIY